VACLIFAKNSQTLLCFVLLGKERISQDGSSNGRFLGARSHSKMPNSHQNCPISKRAVFTKRFHFSERAPLVRFWCLGSQLSACRFRKEGISQGGFRTRDYLFPVMLSLNAFAC